MDAKTPDRLRDERRSSDRPRDDASAMNRTQSEQHEKPRTSWKDTLRQHPYWIAIGAAVLLILIAAATLWWLHARHYESTDDAFIDARTVTISSQISGAISEVSVTDNQLVDAGAPLMRIDDQIYQAQLDQATAQVNQAQANIANLDAQIEAQEARIVQADKQMEQAQAALTFAEEEYNRYAQLAKTGSGTVQQAQQSQSNLLQGQANFAGAQANSVAARKQLTVLQTQRRATTAQLEAAQAQQKLNETYLSYTAIFAPVAGRVTKLTAAKGLYATPGQALTMFVPREVWVTANYKESQLQFMRPGQPVELRIDAFPGRTFRGHVDSIQAGSGTAFSLLPAENATGNFVKVVQRVPVKIVFDEPPDVQLGPGMSVVPAVKVR
jgi:membrane fusion protein (multidrug efflux system)